MKKRFTEEQIIGVLRETEIDGAVIRDIWRKRNVSEQAFFRWRNKFGDMTVSDAKKLKDLERFESRSGSQVRSKKPIPQGLGFLLWGIGLCSA